MTHTLIFDQETIDAYAAHYFVLHPKAKKMPIPKPRHPSINEWMIMKRMAMNTLKQKWKDFIIWLVKEQGFEGLQVGQCEIEVTTYFNTNRPHDPDNSVPKFILDGLVEAQVILDDSHRQVKRLSLCCDVDVEHPRTEIKITSKENIDG